MSALALTPEPRREAAVMQLSIDELRVGPPLRERGIDHAHVAALAEVAASWPPIVVHRTTRLVVDGQHRVVAAKQLGLRELTATWFDGSPDDAYVEFVRRNVGHGLPLTLADRRHAARRIMDVRADLSDRGIAAVCGLSPRTVARLREDTRARGARASGAPAGNGRVGRDGRVRPVDPVATRARIAEELARRPDASLRAIASVVGASPETVRSVRNEIRAAAAPETTTVAPDGPPADAVPGVLARLRPAVGLDCREDRAFTDRDGGPQFVDWFDGTSVEQGDLWRYVDAVPLSRIYVIADEARRRAEFWAQFAMAVEGRVRRRA